MVATWKQIEDEAAELAAAAQRLFAWAKHGVGYLATVDATGRPHLAPVCPIAAADNLYLIVGAESPKAADLLRGSAIALHAPLGANDEEVCLSGKASLIVYAYERESVHRAATFTFDPDDPVFRLEITSAFHAVWDKIGEPGAKRHSQSWHAAD